MTLPVRSLDPSNPAEQNRVLRSVMPPVPVPDHVQERIWQHVLAGLTTTDDQRRWPSRFRAARVALVACLTLALVTGIAIAAVPDLASHILGSDDPAVERMEVFKEPDDAEIPAQALQNLRMLTEPVDGVPQGHQAGVIADESSIRVLLDDEMAGVRVGIWGAPTITQRACYVMITGPVGEPFPENGGSGTCAHFEKGWPLSYGFGTIWGGRWGIKGAMADGVASVQVRMSDDTTQDALVGENAFAWVEGSDGRLPVAVEAVLVDGTRIRQEEDLNPARQCADQPSPPQCMAATSNKGARRPPYVVTD